MADFIVDESKFLLNDEEEHSLFENGFTLSCGITVGDKEDESDCWELYLSEDGKHYILAVDQKLHDNWVKSSLLEENAFQKQNIDGNNVYLLFSPSSHRLCRLTNVRVNNSLRYALSLYCAFANTRSHDLDSNLRDGIYYEFHSVILPTYSLVGKVSDRALFNNALRSPTDVEDLTAPDGLNAYLSFGYVKNILNKKKLANELPSPLLESGEVADDFLMLGKKNSLVIGPLVLREHYQVFDTTSDSYILLMDSLWTEALMSSSLINQIVLNSIPLFGKKHYFLSFKKKFALENMDDRHYAINQHDAFELALAIKRTRKLLNNSELNNALYVQSLGILLPEVFTKAEDANDVGLLSACLKEGPFATSPFLDDINEGLLNTLGK